MPALVVDTQHHWFPPRYRAALAAQAARNERFAAANGPFLQIGDDHPGAQLLERLPAMDEAGIDVAVLSLPPPAAVFADAAAAAETVATANDELIEACGQAPERFLVLAGLPLPHLAESLAELERLATHPQVRGVCVGVDGLGHAPDKLALEPLLERVAERSYLFVIHPAGHEPGPNGAFDDYALGLALEWVLWTSLVGLRFALSGLLDRFPTLDIVVPHLGGVLPYLTQRLVDQTAGKAERDLVHYLTERFYYDNCSYHPPALRCAAETVGPERIMLGSDYPFRGPVRRCVDDVREAGFGEAETRAMLGGTAARWFTPARPPHARSPA